MKIPRFLSLVLMGGLFAATFPGKAQDSVTLSLSPGYVNEVYYSLSDGIVKTGPRSQWDIAFRTKKVSSSILTNDGAGVVLYTYPHADTTGWASVDTTGIGSWKPMYNDPTDWENGAFSRNATGHPDYGWGKYSEVTHNLTGDSLFVIKLRDGSYQKLWIIKKLSAADIYQFRFARLDGTEEQLVVLDLNPFTGEDFYGYSLIDNAPVSFQAPVADWDFLFTRYMSVQNDGTPYPVIGVLNNPETAVKKFYPVPLDYNDFGAEIWDSTRSPIGWNWKVFNMQTFTYDIVDSTLFFIRNQSEDIYKLRFAGFEGTATGVISFWINKAASAGYPDQPAAEDVVKIFPNPVATKLFVSVKGKPGDDLSLFLTDLSGRQLRADRPGKLAEELTTCEMDVTGVQPGVYFVTVLTAANKMVTKIIINR